MTWTRTWNSERWNFRATFWLWFSPQLDQESHSVEFESIQLWQGKLVADRLMIAERRLIQPTTNGAKRASLANSDPSRSQQHLLEPAIANEIFSQWDAKWRNWIEFLRAIRRGLCAMLEFAAITSSFMLLACSRCRSFELDIDRIFNFWSRYYCWMLLELLILNHDRGTCATCCVSCFERWTLLLVVSIQGDRSRKPSTYKTSTITFRAHQNRLTTNLIDLNARQIIENHLINLLDCLFLQISNILPVGCAFFS